MEENISSSSFVSEKAMITCRLCLTTLRLKNYKSHLKRIHPKANHEDMSGKDQLKISNMFSSTKSTKQTEGEGDDDKGIETVDGNVNVTKNTAQTFQDEEIRNVDTESVDVTLVHSEDNLIEFETRKRKTSEDDNMPNRKRFESGDSAFSESSGGETEQGNKLNQILIELKQVKAELRDLKKVKSEEEVKESGIEVQDSGVEKVLMLLNYSRSVDELQSIGFKYDEKSSKLKCVLCDLSKETTDT